VRGKGPLTLALLPLRLLRAFWQSLRVVLRVKPQVVIGLGGYITFPGGMMAVLPVFWALPSLFLGGAAAAGGIALINSLANGGGIFAPSMIGRYGIAPMIGVMVWGVAMALLTQRFVESRRSRPED
jgi:hypothetical protein